jgi:hypothetical protein
MKKVTEGPIGDSQLPAPIGSSQKSGNWRTPSDRGKIPQSTARLGVPSSRPREVGCPQQPPIAGKLPNPPRGWVSPAAVLPSSRPKGGDRFFRPVGASDALLLRPRDLRPWLLTLAPLGLVVGTFRTTRGICLAFFDALERFQLGHGGSKDRELIGWCVSTWKGNQTRRSYPKGHTFLAID